MRAAILSIALGITCSHPGLAQPLTPIDCGARQGCLRAYLAEGFHSLDARPVALPGDRIGLLAVDGLGKDAALWRLDLSVADGSVAGAIEVEIDGQDLAMVTAMLRDGHGVRGELSPMGTVFALFLLKPMGNQLRVFGASGKPMGTVQPPYRDPWPTAQQFEWTPVDLFQRFAGMNALRFEADGLRLDHAGLAFVADYRTGVVTVSGPAPADSGDLVDVLDPAFDPVGQETYWFGADMVAATNYPADGVPAQLALLQGGRVHVPYAMPPQADRGDRVLEGNPAGDLGLSFAAPILTPDGRRLAVLRRTDSGSTVEVHDTVPGKPAWSSALPSDPAAGSTLVWATGGELVHLLQSDAGIELYVYQP